LESNKNSTTNPEASARTSSTEASTRKSSTEAASRLLQSEKPESTISEKVIKRGCTVEVLQRYSDLLHKGRKKCQICEFEKRPKQIQ
jgi:CTP-dependent riboflavin kinase